MSKYSDTTAGAGEEAWEGNDKNGAKKQQQTQAKPYESPGVKDEENDKEKTPDILVVLLIITIIAVGVWVAGFFFDF